MAGMMMNDMRSEQDILRERIQSDLVAFGSFNSSDLQQYCINPDEFENIEPGLFEAQAQKSKFSNLKEAKKNIQSSF